MSDPLYDPMLVAAGPDPNRASRRGATAQDGRAASPGQGLFLAATIGLMTFGAVHLLAVYKANFTAPQTPPEIEPFRAARAHQADFGPFHATARGGIQILNASYSILLFHAGVLNLLLRRPMIRAGRLRAVTWANIVSVMLLMIVTLAFQFPPPMLFAGVVLALFVASLVRQARAIPQ